MTTSAPALVNHGKLINYIISVTVLEVSPARLALRPREQALMDDEPQIAYDEDDRCIIGSEHTDPTFNEQLGNLSIGQIHSFQMKHPDYIKDNVVALPVSFFKANRIVAGELVVGMTLGVDCLKNKVSISDEALELEVIDIKKINGEDTVILDSNPELSGLTVRVDIKVKDIRDPTVEETQADLVGADLPRF